jgi:lipopolysaccharide export system protein LptA
LLLAGLTTGVYLQRKWAAHLDKLKAPAPAPRDVIKLTNGITFSKVDGKQTIFTVEASKATDFKDRDASLLEDVKITILGKRGLRHDVIHTQSCQYDKKSGGIVCSGLVQFELQSALERARVANATSPTMARTVQVETHGVTFNRASGTATTDEKVEFKFPGGIGEAVGVEYLSEAGQVKLKRNVNLLLDSPPVQENKGKAISNASKEPVKITGASLEYGRDTRVLLLRGPVKVESRRAELDGGELKLMLDETFRAQKLVITGAPDGKNEPQLKVRSADGDTILKSESMTGQFAREGWLTRIEASGKLEGRRQSKSELQEISSNSAILELFPRENQPKELNLAGNALLKSQNAQDKAQKVLQSDSVKIEFAKGTKRGGAKPAHAETLGPGSLEWTEEMTNLQADAKAGSAGVGRTRLRADKLALDFTDAGKPGVLNATGHVAIERTLPGVSVQTAKAQRGTGQLLAGGGWSQMDLDGEVKLEEGGRAGQADQAVFVRDKHLATLTGHARVRDASTETEAPRITFVQATGEIRADGGVRSTEFDARGGAAQLAPTPANISADRMEANSKAGKALYTGHARLWQGDSVMEADSIELQRNSKTLIAAGNVRGVFPQSGRKVQASGNAGGVEAKTVLWHVSAAKLTYIDGEKRAHLEKNVLVQSAEQRMRGAEVDLFFSRGGSAAANAAGAAPTKGGSPGAQQIVRSVGTGGVTVEQGTRRATAERGEYSAAEGKFVMSGGNPTIFDASEGTTTGRQLTFFLADDTIIVDSENGTRTLTKHRVEK